MTCWCEFASILALRVHQCHKFHHVQLPCSTHDIVCNTCINLTWYVVWLNLKVLDEHQIFFVFPFLLEPEQKRGAGPSQTPTSWQCLVVECVNHSCSCQLAGRQLYLWCSCLGVYGWWMGCTWLFELPHILGAASPLQHGGSIAALAKSSTVELLWKVGSFVREGRSYFNVQVPCSDSMCWFYVLHLCATSMCRFHVLHLCAVSMSRFHVLQLCARTSNIDKTAHGRCLFSWVCLRQCPPCCPLSVCVATRQALQFHISNQRQRA